MDTINYAVLAFDGVNLLIPQENVAAIEMTAGMDSARAGGGVIGTLSAQGGEWPVFALNAEFEACSECPPGYRICVAIRCRHEAVFALACEEAGRLSFAANCRYDPMQNCMRLPDSPVESLLLRDGRLLLISDADAMRRYLAPGMAA